MMMMMNSDVDVDLMICSLALEAKVSNLIDMCLILLFAHCVILSMDA